MRIYRADGTEIGRADVVNPGDKVRVECAVRNANTAAVANGFSEQYPMHVKLTNTVEHPTRGLTPFADGSHPVQVNGSTVATSASDNTISGKNGVPVTLVGNTPVTVSWWAEISGGQGGAVALSQELIEDSFKGSQYATVELVDERPLTPGGGAEGADPDDPSTWGEAGADYHYTRLPAANANGWNSSPVTVTFYPGDYDAMDLSAGGESATLTAASPSWTRSADTAGVDLSARARKSSDGGDIVSVTRAGKVKIDSEAPRLSATGRALGAYSADDSPTDASEVSSGLWRLHRTGSSGAVSDATVYREFATTGAAGDLAGASQTESLGGLPNGWWVAEDAAGNRSAPLKVGETEPPAVDRPDPDAPGAPDPAGPPYDPGTDPVPPATEAEDDEGLRHAVIEEAVTEIIDPASPPFGGALDEAKASAMMDYRYAASSAAGIASTADELLDSSGSPISSLDTTAPGACLVRRVITDSQGNTTTINLHYRAVRDSCPPVSPWVPDPADPDGPEVPGDPLPPDGPVATDPDGAQHAEVSADVTEAVSRGVMGAPGAEALLRRHFALASADGGAPTLTVQSMEDASGNRLSAIDLSRAADYRITYLVRDADGNTTAVRLGYHLVSSHVPGVVVTPDPGEIPVNPRPGDDPLAPYPVDPSYPPEVAPDGTQHATIEDEMRVRAQAGEALDLAGARSLVQRRYAFTPEGGGAVAELSLALADAAGAPVAAIDESRPGSWLVTYKVADQNGNTVTVRLRYLVVSEPPEVIPVDPSEVDPSAPTIIPDPSRPTGDKPLEPVSKTVDPETGLVHAVVEDSVTIPTSKEPVTPDQMAALIRSYYKALTTWGDGKVTAGEVRLFDANGNPVEVIDRMLPGLWTAEQLFTDGAGNTTLMRLHVKVVNGSADGSMEGGDNGSGANGAGGSDASAGTSKGSRFSTAIAQLPRTGGPLGPCPLHILFALMALVVSSYSLMRLRRGKDRASERRAEAYAEDASTAEGESSAPFRYTVLDGVVHGTILCCTVALGLLHFCAFDWLFALSVVLIEAIWVSLMLRRSRCESQSSNTTC